MARCHDCDRVIAGGDVCWREVRVGRSTGSGLAYLAGHLVPALGGASHYRRVRLCPDCDAEREDRLRDRRRRDHPWVFLYLVACAFAALLLLRLWFESR